METRSLRLVAIGDELLAGLGDPRGLGWFGRVLAKTPREALSLSSYVLACPEESTEELAERWHGEAARRFDPDGDDRLVIALSGQDEQQGISTARSRLNLANILDAATQLSLNAFVVGPPPTLDPERNRRLGQLSTAFGDVTTRRNHFYVDTFTPLENHEQWRADLAAHEGIPAQQGHGLLAWLVLHRGWYPWLGVSEPQP